MLHFIISGGVMSLTPGPAGGSSSFNDWQRRRTDPTSICEMEHYSVLQGSVAALLPSLMGQSLLCGAK